MAVTLNREERSSVSSNVNSSLYSCPNFELLRGRDGRDGWHGRDGRDGMLGAQGPPGKLAQQVDLEDLRESQE